MSAISNLLKSETFRTIVVPLCLLVTSPAIVIALWQIRMLYDESVLQWAQQLPFSFIENIPSFSLEVMQVFGIFALLQFAMLVLLPGEGHFSSLTPQGNRPWYKLNGPSAYILTHIIVALLWYFDIFSLSWIFYRYGEFLTSMCIVSFVFCWFLYFKGIYFPSTSDSGKTGHGIIWDFWWGTELHPTLFGFNIKQLVNCRIGMIGWQLCCWSACVYQYEVFGRVSPGTFVSAALHFIYLFKFFLWESGYFASMDIQHDRFGYYICWGILNWVPGLYPYATMSLATIPDTYTPTTALLLFIVGALAIYANYAADVQRQQVRQSNGKCKVWGQPAKVIRASYTTGDGKQHQTVLLYSGWWGVARHFHYIAELSSCFLWTLPNGFDRAAPWVYVVFLTILLCDRAYRDELRCQKKYGKYWTQYKKNVPYRMIPYVY